MNSSPPLEELIAADPTVPESLAVSDLTQRKPTPRAAAKVKADSLSARGLAWYTTPTGTPAEIVDPTSGVPLSSYNRRTKTGFDSTGAPQTVSFDATTAEPKLTPSYDTVPDSVDPKTGDIYRKAPSLPWDWRGEDPAIKEALRKKEEQRINRESAAALAPVRTEAALRYRDSARAVKASAKITAAELGGLGIPLTDDIGQPAFDLASVDGPTLATHITAATNREYGSPEANRAPIFGGGRFSTDAEALRRDIDRRKQRALEIGAAHIATVDQMRSSRTALDAIQTQHNALVAQRFGSVNAERTAAGMEPLVIPGLEGVEGVGPSNDIQTTPTGSDLSPVPDIREAIVPSPALQVPDSSSAEFDIPGLPTQDGSPEGGGVGQNAAGGVYSPQSPALAAMPQGSMRDAGSNPAPPSIPDIETAPVAALTAAVKQGIIPNPPDEVWNAAREKQQIIDTAGAHPEIKAALAGAGRGAAFLAAAPIGAGAGAELGALGGPAAEVTIPIGSLIGGLVSGSIGAWGYGKLVDALAQHSDTINSFVASQKLHPGYAAAGELATFGAGLPRAAMQGVGAIVSRAANAAAEASSIPGLTAEAVRAGKAAGATPDAAVHAASLLDAIAKSYKAGGGGLRATIENLNKQATVMEAQGATTAQIAARTARDVLVSAAGMIAIDTALKEGTKALGFADEGQTWGGTATAALLGAMAAGHGISSEKYSSEQVGDILLRGAAHAKTGTAFEDTVPIEKIATDLGVQDTQRASAMARQLTPEETEIYHAFGEKAVEMEKAGTLHADGGKIIASAQQILRGGRTTGTRAVEITQEPGAQAAAGPQIPGLPPSTEPSNATPEIQQQASVRGQPQSGAKGRKAKGASTGDSLQRPAASAEETPAIPGLHGDEIDHASELAQREAELAAMPSGPSMDRKITEGRISQLKAMMEQAGATNFGPAGGEAATTKTAAQKEPEVPAGPTTSSSVPIEDIVPAIRVDGQIVPGQKGETHQEILKRHFGDDLDSFQLAMADFDSKKNPNFFMAGDREISRDELKAMHGVSDSQGLRKKQGEAQNFEASTAQGDASHSQPLPLADHPPASDAAQHIPGTPEKSGSKTSELNVQKASAKPRTVAEIAHAENDVSKLLKFPPGTTHVRATRKGRDKPDAPQPLASVIKGVNVLHEGGPYSRIEALDRKGEVLGKPEAVSPKTEVQKSDIREHTPEQNNLANIAQAFVKTHAEALTALDHPSEAVIGDTTDANTSGIATVGGRITIDPRKLEKAVAGVKDRGAYVREAIAEEVLHVGFVRWSEESPANKGRALAVLEDEPAAVTLTRESYPGFDDLEPVAQAAEVYRVIMQGKTGATTESTWQTIKDFIARMREIWDKLTKATRDIIEEIEARMGKKLKEQINPKSSAAETPPQREPSKEGAKTTPKSSASTRESVMAKQPPISKSSSLTPLTAAEQAAKDAAGDLFGAAKPVLKGSQPKDYSKSSTQITLSEADAKAIRRFAAAIPEADIYTDPNDPTFGREGEPHVTVLYGITSAKPDVAAGVLGGTGQIFVRIGKLSLFKNEKYDVLKAEIESDDLHRLNAALQKAVPFESDYPNYKPHMTVAYLKPGMGRKYVGGWPMEGRTLSFDEVEFRGKDGKIWSVSTAMTLGSASPVQTYDAPIPPERLGAMIPAFVALAREANTPEKFAAALLKLGPKAPMFSQSLWFFAKGGGAQGPDRPDWPLIFSGIETPKAQPAKKTFKRNIPQAPGGAHDLIDTLLGDIGKIKHPETARREMLTKEGKTPFERTTNLGGEWDGWMNLPPTLRRLIFSSNSSVHPDGAATGLGYDSPDALREALLVAWRTRVNAHRGEKTQIKEARTGERIAEKQDADFAKDSKAPEVGDERIFASELNVGDTVEVDGEPLKVTHIDPDSGDVTMEDHTRYGIQTISDGAAIYGQLEKGEQSTDFLSEEDQKEDLTLAKPESVSEQRARMGAAQKKRDEDKAKADMLERAKAPLKGSAGDTTADMFGGGKTPLFNERRDVVESPHDLPTGSSLEPDRGGSGLAEPGGESGLPARPGAIGDAGQSLGESGADRGDTNTGGALSSDVPSAPHGIGGDRPVREPAPGDAERAAGDQQPEGSGGPDANGVAADTGRESDADTRLVVPGSIGTVAEGGRGSGTVATSDSVASGYHPSLTPEQVGDVQFIERRLIEAQKPGALLTNGTGTGKTFSGLGAVHRMLENGAKHILVVAPSDKVGSDWVQTAKQFFGIKDIAQLGENDINSAKDTGEGRRVVVMTYSTLGQNNELVKRPWDAVVTDESHYLSQGQEGKQTLALDAVRALTWHPDGIRRRVSMIHHEDEAELAAAHETIKAIDKKQYLGTVTSSENERAYRLTQRIALVSEKIADTRRKIEAQFAVKKEADRPKVIMLSATPFAYHFSLDYAEGYLFDYPPENPATVGRYNHPSPRSRFYMEHFGYRMRTGKLTQPENAVATGILERRFAEKLTRDGAMSGRALIVPFDYSRDFVITTSALGEKIDEVMTVMMSTARLRTLSAYLGIGDYLARRFLLEALKAREAVARIQKHLAMGRKVVVFHDYKKGGGTNPLRPVGIEGVSIGYSEGNGGEHGTARLTDVYEELRDAVPNFDEAMEQLDHLESPLQVFAKAFPEAGIYNGDVPSKRRREVVKLFNAASGTMKVILVQRASGKEGISLHDTDGKTPRVFMDLGIPGRPTDAIQSEGRIYRYGVQSNAIDEYLTTGTNFERWTFAQTIAQRASTAENLAMGEKARALLQSFANGYNDAKFMEPNAKQGTGGKDEDRARESGDPYANAVALYYTNAKKTGRDKSREGVDYFATPEPLGFKMVEWAGIRPGEKVLEPSAGHGAIARFFPDATNRHAVEPSNELAGRLALNATDTEIHQQRFEDFNIVNKFDVIVMNPPFGTTGRTAVDHVIKAAQHLRDGGRLVALLPEGSTTEKFNKWLNGDDPSAKGVYLSAEIGLPPVTFERAGTGVKTRVVILDKALTEQGRDSLSARGPSNIEGEDIKEFFERLKNRSAPDRPPKIETPTPAFESDVNPDAASAPAPGGRQPARSPLPNRDSVLPSLPTPSRDGDFSPADFKHTKTGAPVFVAKIMRRLSPAEYSAANARAKRAGGYYSAFKGSGAIPGFHFKSAEARDGFIGGGGSPDVLSAASPDRQTREDVEKMTPGRGSVSGDVRAARTAARRDVRGSLIDRALATVKATATALADGMTKMRPYTSVDRLFGEWQGAGNPDDPDANGRQVADREAKLLTKAIQQQFPNPLSRMAIFRYIDTGGDEEVMRAQMAASKPAIKPIYERALNLTAEEKVMVDKANEFFAATGAQAMEAGVLRSVIEDYVTRFVDKSSLPVNQQAGTIAGIMAGYDHDFPSSKFKTRFDHAIRRVHKYLFDLEARGIRLRTMDIAETMGALAQALNHVISDRTLVKGGNDLEAADGRPVTALSGYAKKIEGTEEEAGALLVKPSAKPMKFKKGEEPESLRDYVPVDHAAFRGYKFLGKDDEGRTILLEAEMLVHPDHAWRYRNTFGTSALNRVPGVRAVTNAQYLAKQLLLGWSAFHVVQTGTHFTASGINPFVVHPIDMNDPAIREGLNHGLNLFHWDAKAHFGEGVAASGLGRFLGPLGRLNDHITGWTFEEYIPGLIAQFYKVVLARNLKRFAKELAAGRMTRDQVLQHTAEEANSAGGFGNERYAGSNPTRLHAERLVFLAPRFLKDRLDWVRRAFTKYGVEERRALLFLAIAMAVTAKMIERMLTGENDWNKPFSVVTANREYELRSVPSDIISLVSQPRRFLNGRLSPLISRPALEAITGRDYRGVKRGFGEQLMDVLKTPIPIGLRAVVDPASTSDISPLEKLGSAVGLRTVRHSDITQARILGHKWQQAQGIENPDEAYPPSKYLGLRDALEDGNISRAQREYTELAKKEGPKQVQHGFHASLMKPFSGSAAREHDFVTSLSPVEKQTYQRATAKRARMLNDFLRVTATVHVPPKPAPVAARPRLADFTAA